MECGKRYFLSLLTMEFSFQIWLLIERRRLLVERKYWNYLLRKVCLYIIVSIWFFFRYIFILWYNLYHNIKILICIIQIRNKCFINYNDQFDLLFMIRNELKRCINQNSTSWNKNLPIKIQPLINQKKYYTQFFIAI